MTTIRPIFDNSADAAPVLRDAFARCRDTPGVTLALGGGVLPLAPLAELHPQEPLFALHGARGLTVDGEGAELRLASWRTLFDLTECENVTFRNLTIDCAELALPWTAGRVTAADGTAFEMEAVPPGAARGGLPAQAVMEYDPQARRPARRGLNRYQTEFGPRTSVVRPGVVRVPVWTWKEGLVPQVGSSVVVRHHVYGLDAFALRACTDIRWENVTVYAMPGMGLFADGCRDLSLSVFNVRLRPGRWMSTTADATHFINCRGKIKITDCVFEGMGDDGVNVHSMYSKVVARPDPRTLVLQLGRVLGGMMPPLPEPGDLLEIGTPTDPLHPYAALPVLSAVPDTANWQIVVTLAHDLPPQTGVEDVVANAALCPQTRIHRCTVRRNQARGMLLQTRDALLEDCVFEDVSGAGVHVTCDNNFWWEAIAARDVTVRGCRFVRCDYGAARRGAALDIFADMGEGVPAPIGVHYNVRIEDCAFLGVDETAVFVGSADGVTVTGCRMEKGSAEPVVIRASTNVVVQENVLLPPNTDPKPNTSPEKEPA